MTDLKLEIIKFIIFSSQKMTNIHYYQYPVTWFFQWVTELAQRTTITLSFPVRLAVKAKDLSNNLIQWYLVNLLIGLTRIILHVILSLATVTLWSQHSNRKSNHFIFQYIPNFKVLLERKTWIILIQMQKKCHCWGNKRKSYKITHLHD